MTHDNGASSNDPPPAPSLVASTLAFWRRARTRAVAQWGAGYIAVAFGLQQGIQLFADTLSWPSLIERISLVALTIGLPIVLIVAWSHGDRGRQRITRIEGGLIAVCIVAGVALIPFVLGEPERPQSRSFESATPTIAILPFASLNTDPDGQFFAESISLSVANALAATGLSVISQTETAHHRDAERTGAARDLAARYLVNGEVRRESSVVRVSVRIVDSRDNVTVLSEAFESPPEASAALPNRIATRVASFAWTLQVSASGGANAELSAGLIRSLEMQSRGDYMAAYLSARDMARNYPNEPLAQFLHALNAGMAYWEIPEADFPEAMEAARASAERAHQLAPRFGEAYSADHVLTPRHLWADREAPLRRGLEIDPNAPHLSTWLSTLLVNSGRARDAEPLMEAAVARDPFNPLKARLRLAILLALEDRSGARAETVRAERLWPNAPWIAITQFSASTFEGNPSDAQRMLDDPALREVIEPAGGPQPIHLMVRALSSRSASDVDAALLACAEPEPRPAGPETCLVGMVMLGKLDEAFRLAERLYPGRGEMTPDAEARMRLTRRGRTTETLFRPQLGPFRADPRFSAVAERVGLLDYWRVDGNEPDFCAAERAPVCDLL